MDIQSITRLMRAFPIMAQPGLDTNRLYQPDTPDNTQPANTNTDLLNQFQPRTSASDALTTALSNPPERPVPSRLRNIGASIAGLGAGASPVGIASGQPIGFKYNPIAADQASDKVKYGDFDNKLGDWKTKIASLTGAANEEDRANAGEVKRLAGNEQRNINQQKADILQQRADTEGEKNRNIYEVKKAENLRKVEEADAKLALAKQALDLKKDNIDALKEYHKAQLASIDARRRAQTDDDAYRLAETKRLHDAQIARMEALNANLGNNKDTQTDTTLIGADGQPTTPDKATGSRRITRRGIPSSNSVTNPDTGEIYDTSTWSEADKAAAKARGWK